MSGAVAVDMRDGLVHRIHDLAGKDIVQIFGSPILLRRFHKRGHNGAGRFIRPDLYLLFIQTLFRHRKEFLRHAPMDQQGLAGVADADPLGFRVKEDL